MQQVMLDVEFFIGDRYGEHMKVPTQDIGNIKKIIKVLPIYMSGTIMTKHPNGKCKKGDPVCTSNILSIKKKRDGIYVTTKSGTLYFVFLATDE